MALRTGTISQQTRASRDTEKIINDLRKQILNKRVEIKNLIRLLHRETPKLHNPEIAREDPTTWRHLKKMAKETLEKISKSTSDLFIRPTRTRVRTYASSGGESITQQHMQAETDINLIIKRHSETGNISHLNPKAPLYLDCTKVRDLQGAIRLVEEAEDNFATLPAEVRKACRNDPVEFMDMLHTEEGTNELAEAGLEFATGPKTAATDQIKSTRKPETTPPQQLEGPPPTSTADTISPQGGE